MNKDLIAFKKGYIVDVDITKQAKTISRLVMTLNAELNALGYTLSKDLLFSMSDNQAKRIYKNIIPFIKEVLGVGNHQPLFRNFPKSVIEASEMELRFVQIMHYLDPTFSPEVETVREVTLEEVDYKILEHCSDVKFKSIFTNLVGGNQSLSPFDLSCVEWFVENPQYMVMPSEIPFKETLCKLASMGIPNLPIKTPTDVLRIATHMSGGDISLPHIPKSSYQREKGVYKFKKFSRPERKYILSLLESTSCDVSEMKLKLNRWIRLGEILHPMQHVSKFPKCACAFSALRNDAKECKTFYSTITPLIKKGVDIKTLNEGLKVLSSRPGEFARRLDYLVRTHNTSIVLEAFNKISDKVSVKVLVELYNHFSNRNTDTQRSVMIKGKRNLTTIPTLKALPQNIIDSILETIIFGIVNTIGQRDAMVGNYYVDPNLKGISLPTNMRTASTGKMSLARGSRIKVKESKFLRLFVHWYDANGREDLDLSAWFIDNKGATHTVSWNSSHKERFSVFSGDVRHKVGDCAEYIDVDLAIAKSLGMKYFVMSVNNFEGRPLNTLPCNVGWMERDCLNSNAIFKPETVKHSIKLESSYKSTYPIVFDMETMEVIFVDASTSATVMTRDSGLKDVLEKYKSAKFLSVYDLLVWNITARGGNLINDLTEINEEIEVVKYTLEDISYDMSIVYGML